MKTGKVDESQVESSFESLLEDNFNEEDERKFQEMI
jgi:hypothetical protein